MTNRSTFGILNVLGLSAPFFFVRKPAEENSAGFLPRRNGSHSGPERRFLHRKLHKNTANPLTLQMVHDMMNYYPHCRNSGSFGRFRFKKQAESLRLFTLLIQEDPPMRSDVAKMAYPPPPTVPCSMLWAIPRKNWSAPSSAWFAPITKSSPAT